MFNQKSKILQTLMKRDLIEKIYKTFKFHLQRALKSDRRNGTENG